MYKLLYFMSVFIKGVVLVNHNKMIKVFEQYMKKFNLNKNSIKARYFHALKVMELSEDIASTLGIFSEEEVTVCGLIGLFHDLASFNETSYELDNEDETKVRETVDIIFEEGLIRKITNDTKYDNIIKIAIYCYNKTTLPDKLDPKIIHFCQVLKDAHKIDNFRLVLNYPYVDFHIDEFPTELVYNTFKEFRTVNNKVSENNADDIIIVLSETFSLNYRYSYQLLMENEYISKMIHSLIIKNKNINRFFKQIEHVLNQYVKRKIGG